MKISPYVDWESPPITRILRFLMLSLLQPKTIEPASWTPKVLSGAGAEIKMGHWATEPPQIQLSPSRWKV